MQVNKKDLGAGAIFILFGLGYGSTALTSLPIGSALNMGPGYFPVALSLVLLGLGLLIAGRGFIDTEDRLPFGDVPWRGIILLTAAVIFFATFVESLGMLPGVFISTFIATLANRHVKLAESLISSFCIAVFCTVVFVYGIGLPLPVIGEFLSW